MSPREMVKSVATNAGTFMDLKDADSKQFAYGKVWPIMIICCIIIFHAVGNPFDLGTAILLSATAVGPWAFIKFLERTQVTIQHSRTQAGNSGSVVSEQTTQKTGALAPVDAGTAPASDRDPALEYEPTP